MEVRRGLVYDFIRDQNNCFLLQHLGSWLPSSKLPYGSRCPRGPHWMVRGGASAESALLRCPLKMSSGAHWMVRGGIHTGWYGVASTLDGTGWRVRWVSSLTLYCCSHTTLSLVFCNIDTWPHLRTRTAGKYTTLCLAAVFPTRYQFSYILEHGVGNLCHSDLLCLVLFFSGGDHLQIWPWRNLGVVLPGAGVLSDEL